jgi:hypothetical protein
MSLVARQRIPDPHRSVPLAVGQILGVQNLRPCDLSGLDHQGIPERDPVMCFEIQRLRDRSRRCSQQAATRGSRTRPHARPLRPEPCSPSVACLTAPARSPQHESKGPEGCWRKLSHLKTIGAAPQVSNESRVDTLESRGGVLEMRVRRDATPPDVWPSRPLPALGPNLSDSSFES